MLRGMSPACICGKQHTKLSHRRRIVLSLETQTQSNFQYKALMITRIQTHAFRSLKGVDQNLAPFQALIGPNASGKTTFLDVIAFFSDLISNRGDGMEP